MSKPKRRPPDLSKEPVKINKTTPTGKQQPRTKPRASWPIVTGLVVVILGLVLGGLWLTNSKTEVKPSTTVKVNPPKPVGNVDCEEIPKFVQDLNMSQRSAFSTSERGVKGLVLVQQSATTNGPNQIYQKPSWTSAGNLAPLQFGKGGTLFVAPAPSINVLDNPVNQQNQVYRVDNNTGEMARFVALPQAAPANPENPFGVLGLGYDCETDKLYVASVAGSSRDHEVGRLYEVDATKATVLSQSDNLDVLGLAVFNSAKGKRLYYGLARWPEVWSIALDANGSFQGQPRLEVSLANLGSRGSDKARKIEFTTSNQMVVHGIEFSFNLIAPTEKQETNYSFNYDATADKWTLQPNQQS